MFREAIRFWLEQESDISVVGKAASAEEALIEIERIKPDIVLLDISLPAMSGIELAQQLRNKWPDLSILVLSSYDFSGYVRSLAKVGIAGYVLKTAPIKELVQAIREVASGGAIMSPTIASKLLQCCSNYSLIQKCTPDQLTPREIEVLYLMRQGVTNSDIAKHLSISIRTVESHVSSILSKIGVRTRTEAVYVAQQKGMVKRS